MFKKQLLLLALVLLTSACSHMPLSTMVSMSTFDVEDFVAIKPNDIRVKVRADKPLDFDDGGIRLEFKLKSPTGNQEPHGESG